MHGRVHQSSCVCPSAAHLRIPVDRILQLGWLRAHEITADAGRCTQERCLGAHPVPIRGQHPVARDRGPHRSVRLVDEEVRRPVRLHPTPMPVALLAGSPFRRANATSPAPAKMHASGRCRVGLRVGFTRFTPTLAPPRCMHFGRRCSEGRQSSVLCPLEEQVLELGACRRCAPQSTLAARRPDDTRGRQRPWRSALYTRA